MKIQNVSYQNNYSKSSVTMGKNIPCFTGSSSLGDKFVKVGKEKLQLPELIREFTPPVKKETEINWDNIATDVVKSSNVVIDKDSNPHNLLLKEYTDITVQEGTNISGTYATCGCIEFNGILEKTGNLFAPEGTVAIFKSANVEGKIIAGDLRIHGCVGKNGVEIKAASVTIGEDPFVKKGCGKLEGPLKIDAERVYIEKGVTIPKGSIIKAGVIDVQPGALIEEGVQLEGDKVIMMGEALGPIEVKCNTPEGFRLNKTPNAAEQEEIRRENENFLDYHLKKESGIEE